MNAAEPPYLEIASVLRQRIASGELAPGDLVPSTREITREWKVAMATATKALTTIRLEGLVRAVPGVGTMVSDGSAPAPQRSGTSAEMPGRRPRVGTDRSLTRERIVSAAVTVADAEGLSALSMRRVAVETGVATMSLYRHVTDKDDLLLHMLDAVFAETPLPQEGPEGWRAQLELAGRLLWHAFRLHPWLASALSLTRPPAVPGGLAYTEWVLGALEGMGLDPATMLTTHLTLFNWAFGQGPTVRSPMLAILMAMTGRQDHLDQLSGDRSGRAASPPLNDCSDGLRCSPGI